MPDLPRSLAEYGDLGGMATLVGFLMGGLLAPAVASRGRDNIWRVILAMTTCLTPSLIVWTGIIFTVLPYRLDQMSRRMSNKYEATAGTITVGLLVLFLLLAVGSVRAGYTAMPKRAFKVAVAILTVVMLLPLTFLALLVEGQLVSGVSL